MPLTANERILVLSDVARVLPYLHSEVCVIHRDVKSANVLLDRGCRDRVGDFDIARSLNDNHSVITYTYMDTEHVMGTQVYMAPEYHRGVCCSEKVRGRAGGRRRRNSGTIYDRSNVYRIGGSVTSAARQHRAADGIEQGRYGTLRLDGGLVVAPDVRPSGGLTSVSRQA